MRKSKIKTSIILSSDAKLNVALNARVRLTSVLLFVCISAILKSQTVQPFQQVTYASLFDTVYDQHGSKFPLANVSLNSKTPFSLEVFTVSPPPSNSCSAGYFDLYFAPGSMFDTNPSAAAVACQVFSDVSMLINSPLSSMSNTLRVNFYCGDVAPSNPAGALGGLLYAFIPNSIINYPGIIRSQCEKIVLSGQDPYANIVSLSNYGNAFYHGTLDAKPTIPWNFNLSSSSISPTQYDLYSVLLHEVMHCLGFNSLIAGNGSSLIGAPNTYYTMYDTFLKTAGGSALLGGSPLGCSTSSLSFQQSSVSINPSCPGLGLTDVTTCSAAVVYSSTSVNPPVAVYTPGCFEVGSSLSHFEDMCSYGSFTTSCVPSPTAPGYNNLYFAMSNSVSSGSCYVKRHITEEERYVLCDLGYSVNAIYSPTVAGAAYTYTGGSCSGPAVWGVNDGYSNGFFSYTTTATSYSVALSTLLSNDSPNSTSVSCVQVVWNNGTVSIASGSLILNAFQGSGLVVLKYTPRNNSGQPGNETYVYYYFVQNACGADYCSIVQNGGFESLSPASTQSCGPYNFREYYKAAPSCWIDFQGTPDVYRRNCGAPYDLTPVTDTYNGPPNNAVLGMGSGELSKNWLSSPLIPGQPYELSIWAYNGLTFPISNSSLVITVSADVNMPTNTNTPTLSVLASYTVGPGVWTAFTNTFVFTPTLNVNHWFAVIGIDGNATSALNATTTVGYCYFDDFRITPLSGSLACCPVSTVNYTGTTVSGNISGSRQFTTSVSVPTGSTCTIEDADFKFGPNIQITVNSGASLIIKDSHLYSCTGKMWTGIVVNDGGNVIFDREDYDNLVEDAIIAVDISGHTTSTLSTILSAQHTTFNKNHTSVRVSGYIRNSSSYPFSIRNCIFTCRTFTYSNNQWPQTDPFNAGGLKYAVTNATLDIATPYLLQNAAVADLLNPYTGNSSKTGIELTNVGLTSGSNFYGIVVGTTLSPSYFNLFDNQSEGIFMENSNLQSINNVFQETNQYRKTIYSTFYQYTPGHGIRHTLTNLMNTKLDMSASSPDLGNRFWNCHIGVEAQNVYRLDLTNAIFRSSQTNTQVPANPPSYPLPVNAMNGFLPGTFGLLMRTNKLNALVRYNEFTNVNTGIQLSIMPASYTLSSSTPSTGIYGYKMAIANNTLSPLLPPSTATSVGSNYMDRAIVINSTNNTNWNVSSETSGPYYVGITVTQNTIKRVFGGVSINGMPASYRTWADNNVVSLEPDNVFNIAQYGIKVTNTAGKHTTATNTLSAVSSWTTPVNTLAFFEQNGGVGSPLVICNSLSNAFQGFEFSSSNSNSKWRGNDMSTLNRGLVISNNAIMGQQGTNAQSCNNKWLGSTWTGSNYGTFVTSNSDATLSPMYVKPSTTPPNNGGDVSPSQIFLPSASIFTASGGDYNCVSAPNSIPLATLTPSTFADDNYFFIAATNFYRTLDANDSLRLSATTYSAFYSSLAGSSIDLFLKTEKSLYAGDYSSAEAYLGAVTTTNTVEEHYLSFYSIYSNFLHYGDSISPSDSTDLHDLTKLCPGKDGAVIHQARAFYEQIFAFPQRYSDNCNEETDMHARMPLRLNEQYQWTVDIFPNPTSGYLTIQTPKISETLYLCILDITGRKMINKNVKTEDFVATLELTLENGAYLLTIRNSQNETVTKKLVVAK